MESPLTFLLMIVIGFVSYLAFHQPLLHDRLVFDSREIRQRRGLSRYVTSGFVHLDIPHLLMNLLALFFFGPFLEMILGPGPLLVVFIVGTITGNVASLATHHAPFRGAGASSGGAAILFASVLIAPFMGIRPFLLPFPLDAWLWASLYLGGSIYAMYRRDDGIGHDAHIGGGIGGLLVAAILRPAAATTNAWVFLLLLAVVAGMRLVLFPSARIRSAARPRRRTIRPVPAPRRPRTVSRTASAEAPPRPTGNPSPRAAEILEEARSIDAILEKISTRGLDSLTPEERKALERFSERRRARRSSPST